MHDPHLHGIYAITDPVLCGAQLYEKVLAAIEGGIRVLQYRNKQGSRDLQREETSQLLSLCQQHDVLFIINDDIELAEEINADGVHLGQQDRTLNHARQRLGNHKIIGISCNNRFEYALRAQQQSADYVAFGRFFPSQTKPQAPQAELELLHRAHIELQLPVVAIGGITPSNGRQLIEAGADMLAVIHGIFAQPDVRLATRRYVELFQY
jgi:thiamine-phosphate pyrophosphorylase